MKKCLFWITVPIGFVLVLIASALEAIGATMVEWLHAWEAWCLDYKKHHIYLGDGIWTDKDNPAYNHRRVD